MNLLEKCSAIIPHNFYVKEILGPKSVVNMLIDDKNLDLIQNVALCQQIRQFACLLHVFDFSGIKELHECLLVLSCC